MNATRRFECDARLDQLPALLEFVDAASAESELPEDVAFAVRLAAEEACMNVMVHGYRDLAPGPLILTIERDDARVVVTVQDNGRPFDPEQSPIPSLNAPLEDRAIGGLGWHLIKNMMDEVHHAYDAANGNTLELVKRIPQPAGEEH